MCINDVSNITIYGINNLLIRTYDTQESKLALNSAWNEDLLPKELSGLKSTMGNGSGNTAAPGTAR